MNVEIACVVDRSGSMETIKNDTIGGFNSFLKKQKELPGEAIFTLVLFDHEYQTTFNAVNLKDIPELTSETFVPRGTTALYDAIGRTIDCIGSRLDKMTDKPEKIIIVILTDGHENASCEYTHARVAEMIKHQQEKYGWEFIFLAANQDAFATGSALNIKTNNTQNYAANSKGVMDAFTYMSNTTASLRN